MTSLSSRMQRAPQQIVHPPPPAYHHQEWRRVGRFVDVLILRCILNWSHVISHFFAALRFRSFVGRSSRSASASGLRCAARNARNSWKCFSASVAMQYRLASSLSSSLGMGLRRGTFSRPSENAPGRRQGGSLVGSARVRISRLSKHRAAASSTMSGGWLRTAGSCSRKSSRSGGGARGSSLMCTGRRVCGWREVAGAGAAVAQDVGSDEGVAGREDVPSRCRTHSIVVALLRARRATLV
ncbi:hypothetical protein LXA43DRAFT_636707 [Ganoderma leucocontextum]|nr:hypothetical protein LXA43DRAFT_636707 [Ganoderma leucocontextum]